MRFLFWLCLFCNYVGNLNAQSSLSFTIQQLPLLVVDAGKDTTVAQGQHLRLGATIPASGGSSLYSYSWTPIVGLDSPSVARPMATIDTTIIYNLTVDDGAGCAKSSSIKVTSTRITSIDAVTSELGLSIAPNPSAGTFYISTRKPLRDPKLVICFYDAVGRLLYSETIAGGRTLNKRIVLPSAAKGYYILQIKGKELGYTQKILVH